MNWIFVHPWMTFFIALAVVWGVEGVISSVCKTVMVHTLSKNHRLSSKDIDLIINGEKEDESNK